VSLPATAELDRWARTAALLASLPASVVADRLPGRLVADTVALRDGTDLPPRLVVLAAGPGDAERLLRLWYPVDEQPLAAGPVRITLAPAGEPASFRPSDGDHELLAALGPQAGTLPEVAHGGFAARAAVARRAKALRLAAERSPGLLDGRLRRVAEATLPAGPVAAIRDHRPVVTCVSLSPHPGPGRPSPDADRTGLAPLLRMELLDADGLVVVLDYADVVSTGAAARHGDARIAGLGPWARLGLARLGAGRVTVAVDGVHHSRSTAENRRDWIVQQVRRKLGGADLSIVEISSAHAVEAGTRWPETGVPALTDRLFGGWAADRRAAAAEGVRHRLDRAVADLGSWCDRVLALADPPGTPLDAAVALDPDYVRTREAWLLARGAAPLLRAVAQRSSVSTGETP